MVLHLPDPDSPKITIVITNPFGGTWPTKLDSRAYCGVLLKRQSKTYPDLLWECVNYIMPCSILEHLPDVCWDCVAGLDQIRNKQGYRPIVEELRNPENCRCVMWVLQRQGCRCGVK